MAASLEQCVRVKLFFDNACLEPSWFTVSVKKCKRVSDVEQRIISKFKLECDSVKLILSDCRLPPWESAMILRENDCLHVRRDQLTQESVQEACDKKKKTKKKKSQRASDTETDGETQTDMNFTDTSQPETCALKQPTEVKATKSINPEQQEHTSMVEEADMVSVNQSTEFMEVLNTVGQGSEKKKRKRKRKNKKRDNTSVQEINTKDNHQARAEVSCSVNRHESSLPYPRFVNNKRIIFNDDGVTYDNYSVNGDANQEHPDCQLNDNSFDQSMMEDKSSKRQKTADTFSAQNGSPVWANSIEESVLPSGITVYTRQKRQRTSYVSSIKERHLNDRATNKSIILTNDASPASKESTSNRIVATKAVSSSTADYSQFPDLDCPPRNGDKIAYKIIELSDNCCPEVSDYKEARVVSYDPISTVVELELLTKESVDHVYPTSAQSKFSMDGDAAVSSELGDNRVSVELGSLLEPKLLS